MNFLRHLAKDTRGASLVEYALLVAIIASAAAAFVPFIAQQVENRWATLNSSTAPPAEPNPDGPSYDMSLIGTAATRPA